MENFGYGFMPSHPGLLLKDEIEFREISQRKLADDMQMSYSVMNEILNGKRTLSPRVALMFEAALGVDADTLMRMQARFNMQLARNDKSLFEKLKELRKIAAL